MNTQESMDVDTIVSVAGSAIANEIGQDAELICIVMPHGDDARFHYRMDERIDNKKAISLLERLIRRLAT
jgi:hypothetical protein